MTSGCLGFYRNYLEMRVNVFDDSEKGTLLLSYKVLGHNTRSSLGRLKGTI